MHIHTCPKCKSHEVHRSRKRGLFEVLVAKAFFLQPFRCHSCFVRHYRFALPRGVASRRKRSQQRIPRLGALMVQRLGLVAILILAPILLAHSGQVIEAFGTQGRGSLSRDDSLSKESSLLPTGGSHATTFRRATWERRTHLVTQHLTAYRTSPLGQVVNSSHSTIDGNALAPDTVVFSGDLISSGSGGAALVSFPGSREAVLAESTTVRFIGEGKKEVVAEVLSGNLQVTSPADRALLVRTSQYTITPQGAGQTKFRVEVEADHRATVETQSGHVTIRRLASGGSVNLARGLSAEIPVSDNAISGQGPEQGPVIGTVVSSKRATRGGAALSGGSPVFNDDLLETGARGNAIIKLSPETRVSLAQNTLARFTSKAERVWVQLRSGRVVADSTGEKYPLIETPRFHIEPTSARHSVIYVEVMADNSTYIESDAGDVRIEKIQSGKSYVMTAGDRIFVPANSTGIPGLQPQPPVRAAATPVQTPSQIQPASHPQPGSGPRSSTHKTLLVLGFIGAAGTAGIIAALAAKGGVGQSAISPSVP